jgi:hypothetical protein
MKLTSLEELLAAAERADNGISNKERVRRFVAESNILPGTVLIHSQLIYKEYLKWEKDEPLNQTAFFIHLSKMFKKHTYKNRPCYLMKADKFLHYVEETKKIIEEEEKVLKVKKGRRKKALYTKKGPPKE